jgi:hypothetical protein
MGRQAWAALCVAGAMALAGQANAAVIEAVIYGDWNDDFPWRSWSVDVVYDTSRATENVWTDPNGALGHQLIYTAGSGPSPVLSETVTLYGWKTWQQWLGDYDTFTPIPDQVTSLTDPIGDFEIFQSPNAFVFDTPMGTVGASGAPMNLGLIPFGEAGQYHTGFYNYWIGPAFEGGEEYTSYISLSVVPEPAIWAMMLVGFFGLGSALRLTLNQRVVGSNPTAPTMFSKENLSG